MIHKKPTGKIGPIRVQTGPNQVELSWEIIAFPQTKDEIERYVVQQFVAAFQKEGANFPSVEQNPENHFDFTLVLPGGPVFMDLMELIYRDAEGKPYETSNTWIETATYAGQIVEAVLTKSNKYIPKGVTPIHLLTYITHWRFVPDGKVTSLVQYGLRQNEHLFENVFLLVPFTSTDAELRVLFPSSDKLFENFDPSSLQDDGYLNLDPGDFQLVTPPQSRCC